MALIEKQVLEPYEKQDIYSWCSGSSDQSLMVDPLSYFLIQPVLHDWCNKDHGMCYPVCGMVHTKESLLLIKPVPVTGVCAR